MKLQPLPQGEIGLISGFFTEKTSHSAGAPGFTLERSAYINSSRLMKLC
jgi:hypothetical protein